MPKAEIEQRVMMCDDRLTAWALEEIAGSARAGHMKRKHNISIRSIARRRCVRRMSSLGVFIGALVLLPAGVGHAQWEPATALFSEPAIYGGFAASGKDLHAAQGEGTVRYRGSRDEGSTWRAEMVLGSGLLFPERPVAAEGSNVAIGYVRDTRSVSDSCCRRPLGNIFLRVSRDRGESWEPETQVTTSQGVLRFSVGVSGSRVHVVWMDYRSGTTWDLYYRRSIDGGRSWEPEVRLIRGTNPAGAGRPQIAVLGDSVHIAWMDARNNSGPCTIEGRYTLPECTEVYHKRSTDGGGTWEADRRLTTGSYSGRPDITAQLPGTVFISYDHALGGGALEEFLIRSTDDGVSWHPPVRLSFTPGDSSHSSIVLSGSSAYLAWFDYIAGGGTESYFRESSDSGETWGAAERFSSGYTPLLAGTPNYVHAFYPEGGRAFYTRRQAASVTRDAGTDASACGPDCAGRACGDDGCGGSRESRPGPAEGPRGRSAGVP
jgi:hypothetical protein